MKKSRKFILWLLLLIVAANVGGCIGCHWNLIKVEVAIIALAAIIATSLIKVLKDTKNTPMWLEYVFTAVLGGVIGSFKQQNFFWFAGILVVSVICIGIFIFAYTGHDESEEE